LEGRLASLVSMMQDRYGHQNYLLRKQFFKLLGHNFRIYEPSGEFVLFVHQKAFRLKEDIRVYADEAMSSEILTIRARQIIDFSAAYDVVDAQTGHKIGAFKRKGWRSLVRDQWIVMDADDREIGGIEEDQMLLALVRRFLSNLVPQSFDMMIQGRKVCDLRQHFNPFLFKLDIDFSSDPGGAIDRRLALAGAILLTAIEGRQGK
jgi:uncharacterized protein YxjI